MLTVELEKKRENFIDRFRKVQNEHVVESVIDYFAIQDNDVANEVFINEESYPVFGPKTIQEAMQRLESATRQAQQGKSIPLNEAIMRLNAKIDAYVAG